MYLVSLQGQATSCSPGASGWPTECRAGTSAPAGGVQLLHPPQHVGAHAGHDAHRDGDVGGVGDLDAEHRLLGLEVAHHERDDVHRPAPHAALVELAHERLHLVRVHPVVGGPAVLLVDRADVGPVLDACDVDGVGGCVEGVRLDRGVQPREGAGRDQSFGELGPLLVGSRAPVDGVGLGHRGDFVDEVEDSLMGGGCLRLGGHPCFPLAHSRWSPPLREGAAGRRAYRRCVVELLWIARRPCRRLL